MHSTGMAGSFKVGDLVESRMYFNTGKRGFIVSTDRPSNGGLTPITVGWHDGSQSSAGKHDLTKLFSDQTVESWGFDAQMSIIAVQREIDELERKIDEKIALRDVLEAGILRGRNNG